MKRRNSPVWKVYYDNNNEKMNVNMEKRYENGENKDRLMNAKYKGMFLPISVMLSVVWD